MLNELRLKPGSWTVGSDIRYLLATDVDYQSSLYLDAASTGVGSDHIGFLDVRQSGGWLKMPYWPLKMSFNRS